MNHTFVDTEWTITVDILANYEQAEEDMNNMRQHFIASEALALRFAVPALTHTIF